jgi:hypothetical protein
MDEWMEVNYLGIQYYYYFAIPMKRWWRQCSAKVSRYIKNANIP